MMLILESCTNADVENPVNNWIDYLSTGAGFLPSTEYVHLSDAISDWGDLK